MLRFLEGFLFALILVGLIALWILAPRFIFTDSRESPIEATATLDSGEGTEDDQVEALHFQVGFSGKEELKTWTFHSFEGRANVSVEQDTDGSHYLDFQSAGDAMLMLREAPVLWTLKPTLKWDWRIVDFPQGKTNQEFAEKPESDFAARVYVVFEGRTNFTSPTMQYIWDNHFPVGTNKSIPFFKHLKMMVARSEGLTNGEWRSESRNIVEDYEDLYGKLPTKNIRAVGFMTDSDNTGTSARAQYRNIRIVLPSTVTKENLAALQADGTGSAEAMFKEDMKNLRLGGLMEWGGKGMAKTYDGVRVNAKEGASVLKNVVDAGSEFATDALKRVPGLQSGD